MARYTDEYAGIPGGFAPPRGMDPNYRGGYRGMRTEGWADQGEYGRYRFRHPDDFGGSGGFDGGYSEYYGGRVERPLSDRHPEREWGAVQHPRYDRGYLRDFNADSPVLRGDAGRGYDRGMRVARSEPGDAYPGYDPRYTNRGLSSSGFSEGWARGPMRGAR